MELLLHRIPQISRAIRSDQPIQHRGIFSTLGRLSFQEYGSAAEYAAAVVYGP